jgi:hypothetical protein
MGEKKKREREKNALNRRVYVLPAMPKGSAWTLLGPMLYLSTH